MSEQVVKTEVIESTLYGEIQVSANQVYHFTSGIVGFEHLNKFALLPYEDSELYILQAFYGEVGLMLIPASITNHHLEFEIEKQAVELLQIDAPEDVIVFYVLRIIEGKPFINQKAPILLSSASKKGCQYIVQNDSISVRVPLVLKGDN